jgi:hypothetical protein
LFSRYIELNANSVDAEDDALVMLIVAGGSVKPEFLQSVQLMPPSYGEPEISAIRNS